LPKPLKKCNHKFLELASVVFQQIGVHHLRDLFPLAILLAKMTATMIVIEPALATFGNATTNRNNLVCSHVTQKASSQIALSFIAVFASKRGEGKTTYTFSVSLNAFSVEFPLACYQ
jgi:hypothetical protein